MKTIFSAIQYCFLLTSIATPILAQIPDDHTIRMLGINFSSGSQSGLYIQSKPGTNNFVSNGQIDFAPTDKGTNSNLDARFLSFDKNSFFQANLDGVLYFCAAAFGLKKGNPDNIDFYGASFKSNDVTNKLNLAHPTDIRNYNIINYKMVQCVASHIYGSGFMLGGQMDIRYIGISSNGFTWKTYDNYTFENTYGTLLKLNLGVNIGFRTYFGPFTSLSILSFSRNIKNGESISIESNPAFSTTLFYGKKYGFYTTLNYEMLNGKILNNNLNIPLKINTLEIKFGLYL
jgi:hypothetical protein